jgi:hypothetical protein
MKAFRIRLNRENTFKSSVEFIFLAKCISIDVNYSTVKESAVIEIYTFNENFYTLTKYMDSLEYQLFASKIEKFKYKEDLFFDLGEFNVVLEQNHHTSG